jgi:hypothetical protein
MEEHNSVKEQNPVHINIYKENKESIDSSSNKAEAYIILVNEELNNKNRDLVKEVADLTSEKDILEDENGRMEKSITYQRGLLHNLSELNKLEAIVTKQEKELNKIYMEEQIILNKYIKEMEYNTKLFMGIICIVLLLLCAVGLIDITSVIFIVTTTVSVYYGMPYINKIDPKVNVNFDEKRKLIIDYIKVKVSEIDKITSSSDFLGDYIESM